MFIIVSIFTHADYHASIVLMGGHGARICTVRVDDDDGRLAARRRAIKVLRRLALLGRPAPKLLMRAIELVGGRLCAIRLRSDVQVLRVDRLLVVLRMVMGVNWRLLRAYHLVGQADGVKRLVRRGESHAALRSRHE